LIFEVIGGTNFAQSIAACRMGGRIAAIGFLSNTMVEFEVPDLLLNRTTIAGLAVGSHADQNKLVDYIEKVRIMPVIGEKHSLSLIGNVIRKRHLSSTFGKHIITME